MRNKKKKVLILETAVSHSGVMRGGSYIQASYYNNLLNRHGYISKIYINHTKGNFLLNFIKIIFEITHTEYVMGFGTPLLNICLQWLCLILNKKGVYCTDTIIVQLESVNDQLKRRFYNKSTLIYSLIQHIVSFILIRLSPPKLNLINITSCKYVKDKLINTAVYSRGGKFLLPVVDVVHSSRKFDLKLRNILYYGALFRGRGVIDLLKACQLLWKKNYQFKLIILGWPVERQTYKTLINKINQKENERIIIGGKKKNILDLVRASTAVVLPFRYPCSFQTPYTLLEPMGLGVPVITTDVGSHTEWVTHGETGLICKKENPVDLAEKIESIFTDKHLVDKITKGAIDLLKKRYRDKDLLLEMIKKL